MPGITNPAEEYFKDGLWGWVTDQWKKLVATAGGALHIQFAGQEADVEVKQATPADLTPGVCGWDGDSWQKLPMLWGYSAIWDVDLGGNAAAADYGVNTPAGAAGEVWILQGVGVCLVPRDPSKLYAYVSRASGAVVYLGAVLTPGANVPLAITCNIALVLGDAVYVGAGGCVAGDAIQAGVFGYKMKIAE